MFDKNLTLLTVNILETQTAEIFLGGWPLVTLTYS